MITKKWKIFNKFGLQKPKRLVSSFNDFWAKKSNNKTLVSIGSLISLFNRIGS